MSHLAGHEIVRGFDAAGYFGLRNWQKCNLDGYHFKGPPDYPPENISLGGKQEIPKRKYFSQIQNGSFGGSDSLSL